MKTNPIAKSRASLALVTLLLLCFSSPSLRAEVFGLFTYRVVGGATVEITDYPDNAAGPVNIPAQIAGKPVTSIGNYAFYYCPGLTSVTIPNSVTSIGYSAFEHCTGLTSIAVDPLNPSYVGLDGVLFNKSLTILLQYPGGKAGSYTIPNSVTSVGYDAFRECHHLTGVTIPNSVTSIGYSAFEDCTGLTSIAVDPLNPSYVGLDGVLFNKPLTTLITYPQGKAGSYTIPNSVTSVGFDAFSGCVRLTGITIPNSVTTISGWAFRECYGLNSVTIPNSVTSIGRGAFYYCFGLTSVTIPNSVTSIGNHAFAFCGGTNLFL